jgi:hypothetical protein
MAQPPESQRVVIQPLTEYRIELEKGEGVAIRLLNGAAEIFGYELAPGIDYPFTDEVRAAVFTWTGCEIEMSLAAAAATTLVLFTVLACFSRNKATQRPLFWELTLRQPEGYCQ